MPSATSIDDVSRPRVVELTATTVTNAYQRARREAVGVVYLPSADRSVRQFSGYSRPARLYAALTCLSGAVQAWRGDDLPAGFSAYFLAHGFRYSQHSPTAHSSRTRAAYRTCHQGRDLLLEAHLRVEQATRPDQCLRIYWALDEVHRQFIVGHVGRHLP